MATCRPPLEARLPRRQSSQEYTAPARQHELDHTDQEIKGSALKERHYNGIDYLSDVWKLCTRMNLRNRKKKTAVVTRGQAWLPLCCRYP